MALAYKLLTLLMIAVMGTGAAGGAALASADSLPGEALYPVKLAVEEIRLSLAADPTAQAQQTMSFAAERLREMEALAEKAEPIPDKVVARLVRQMERVMNEIALARPEDASFLMERFTQQIQIQQQVLEGIQAGGPDGGQLSLQNALQAIRRINQAAEESQGDPLKLQYNFQNRVNGPPAPADEPETPQDESCPNCSSEPVRSQDQLRERYQDQHQPDPPDTECTPVQLQSRDRSGEPEPGGVGSPGSDQDPSQYHDRDQNPEGEPAGPSESRGPSGH